MRKIFLQALIALVTLSGFSQAVSAQFPIKIPKIKKTDHPKTDDGSARDDQSGTNTSKAAERRSGAYSYMPRIEPTDKPVLLRDTVEIRVKTENHYWKVPNDNYFTSWIPQIGFEVFVEYGTRTRYTVEWFNSDGSPWFTEAFDSGDRTTYATTNFQSEHSGEPAEELFKSKASIATGTYGVKITDNKSNQVVFQGKFKVNKIAQSDSGDARRKNLFMFYVDNDWLLPTGYVGFTYSGETSWEKSDPQPLVFMWFKGELKADSFEAKLFYNNQELATTDGGGYVNDAGQSFGEGCYAARDLCSYKQWIFAWKNFFVEDTDSARVNHPDAIFTRDKPGEYTVKIFYKGAQVRETKFTIDQKGWIAPNQFSSQFYLSNYKVLVPAKVMGSLDKWNAAAWKTDAFYGNVPNGFAVP
jgi:hypothetical protein